MRKASLIACALLLWGEMAAAQSSDYIRYYPPAGLSTMTGTASATTTTVPFLFADGTAAVPSIAWSSDADGSGTGFYRNATNQIGIAANGTVRWIFDGVVLGPAADDTGYIGGTGTRLASIRLLRSLEGSKSKTLTDAAAAVSFVRIAVATNASAGGTVIWNAMSTDGTAPLTQAGMTYFAGVNTAGTVTCTVGAVGTPITAYSRVNTLACTVTTVTSTTNCDLQVTCTDNLAGDQTPVFNWRIDQPVINAVTPQ